MKKSGYYVDGYRVTIITGRGVLISSSGNGSRQGKGNGIVIGNRRSWEGKTVGNYLDLFQVELGISVPINDYRPGFVAIPLHSTEKLTLALRSIAEKGFSAGAKLMA